MIVSLGSDSWEWAWSTKKQYFDIAVLLLPVFSNDLVDLRVTFVIVLACLKLVPGSKLETHHAKQGWWRARDNPPRIASAIML